MVVYDAILRKRMVELRVYYSHRCPIFAFFFWTVAGVFWWYAYLPALWLCRVFLPWDVVVFCFPRRLGRFTNLYHGSWFLVVMIRGG